MWIRRALINLLFVVIFLLGFFAFLPKRQSVSALVCAPQRVVNEWSQACENNTCVNKVYQGTPNCSAAPDCKTNVWLTCTPTSVWVCDNDLCDAVGHQCDCPDFVTSGGHLIQSCSGGTKQYGCWVLGNCGDPCSGNFDCHSNQCVGGACANADGSVCNPGGGGGGGGGGCCAGNCDDGCKSSWDSCQSGYNCLNLASCGSKTYPDGSTGSIIWAEKSCCSGSVCGGGGGTPQCIYNVQGLKRGMPGNSSSSLYSSQTVANLTDGQSTTSDPFFFTNLQGNKTISVSVPTGYSVGYTLCYNDTNCHNQQPVPGNTAGVNCVSDGSYADLWWHYDPPKTCTVSQAPVSGNPNQFNVTISGNANSYTADTVALYVTKFNGTQQSTPITYTVGSSPTYTAETIFNGTHYFYLLTNSGCSSTYGTCTTTTKVTLPPGNYYALCNVAADPRKCSGNPFITQNGGSMSAPGWASCSGPDNAPGGDNVELCSESGPYPSAWSACSAATFTRTRTLSYDCNATVETETENCVGTINGRIFDATLFGSQGAACASLSPALPLSTATATNATTGPPRSDVADGSGNYSITGVKNPATYTMTATSPIGNYLATPRFVCNPAVLGNTQGAVVNNVNIGLWSSFGSWYQVAGGNILSESAAGVGIQSLVPDTCSGACAARYLLRQAIAGGADTSGRGVLGASSSIDTSYNVDSLEHYNQEAAATPATYKTYGRTSRSSAREDYANFYRRFDLGASPTLLTNTNLSGLINLAKPNPIASPPQKGAYYANGDVRVQTVWNVAANEKIVIFVNGDLSIENQIHVAPGGFLAFIVGGGAGKGDITIANTVGSGTASSETTQVEGVYIGDNVFTVATNGVQSDDLKFVGAGTFVGWTRVDLLRDFRSTTDTTAGLRNYDYSTELFVARPDLVLNAPIEMKKAVYDWREIAP